MGRKSDFQKIHPTKNFYIPKVKQHTHIKKISPKTNTTKNNSLELETIVLSWLVSLFWGFF